MTRIAPLEPPYAPEIDRALAAMMPPGVPPIALFRTLAHSPRVLAKVRAGNLLDRGPLGLRQRELAILRTTARCGSEYEWGVHVSFFAERAGLDADAVAATRAERPDHPSFDAAERALLRLVDALHETATCSDEGWAALRAHFSTEQCIELVALVGMYHTVSFFTNAFGVAPEPGAARFPEAAPGPRPASSESER